MEKRDKETQHNPVRPSFPRTQGFGPQLSLSIFLTQECLSLCRSCSSFALRCGPARAQCFLNAGNPLMMQRAGGLWKKKEIDDHDGDAENGAGTCRSILLTLWFASRREKHSNRCIHVSWALGERQGAVILWRTLSVRTLHNFKFQFLHSLTMGKMVANTLISSDFGVGW